MNNRISEPLYITLFTVLAFTLWSLYPHTSGYFKPVDFFSELRKKETKAIASADKTDSSKLAKSDTVVHSTAALQHGSLELFFRSLKQQKDSANRKNVRIAYFGDSMIEGDLVTNDLRKLLQKVFGGNGVGFVPVTSVSAGFRSSIRHTFNSNWKAYNFANSKAPAGLYYGPSGFVFEPESNAQVSYKASKEYAGFKTVRLFYGKAPNALLQIHADTTMKEITVSGEQVVNEALLHEGAPVKEIAIEVKEADTASFYGCSFENGMGVYVDNYSFRGNSGIPLSAVSPSVYTSFAEKLNYKLVILHYGLNVVAHNVKDYSWYERSFNKTLAHIKKSFPDASILLISVSDKAYRENNEWNTEPDIPLFVALQEKLAKQNGIAFWNLYEAMGGYNAMKTWAEATPPLANADYTHPNYRGASKIAALLYEHLMSNYKKFNSSNPMPAVAKKNNDTTKTVMP